ncbi:MAG: cytochrome c maturation protein CcmE [Gammaproteobacteria bacterium]|nr:MAG: cytochrome c maturation protein CcmE [Gammaproteobacteria bacterium]
MKPRHKRIFFAVVALVGVVIATVLVTQALRSNIAYYYPPTKVVSGEAPKGELIRVGGMVRTGTLVRHKDSLDVDFIVTDNKEEVKIRYSGILPDLFKEGQGVVTKGRLKEDGVFYAEEVLAKHDESYMPPEVAESMKPETEAAKYK